MVKNNKSYKIKVIPEGRKDIWVPEKNSLKKYILSKKFDYIHNIIPIELYNIGADHDVSSVIEDIDKSERLAIFTDKSMNIGHSLALINNNKLECYDIGVITEDNLIINKSEENNV